MKENNYKEMLVTLNKEVKKLDRIHNAIRKTTNEFASISMDCLDSEYARRRLSHPIKVRESWYEPKAEMVDGKIMLTPDYMFSLAGTQREYGYFDWEKLKKWSPKFVNEDLKEPSKYLSTVPVIHRPVMITRGVTETQADFVFVYTKKKLLEDWELRRAFNNMILGKRSKWVKEATGYPNGTYKEVDRDIKTELDLMTDEDVIFITATGWDQEDTIEIKTIDMWDVETRTRKDFGFDPRQYKETTESFVRGVLQNLIELDDCNAATFWIY
jgi:hypothetical protein